MRSDLVYPAARNLPNRYLLCQVASKATRKFHRPNTRVQDTMNQILEKFGQAEVQGLVSATPALARLERQAA
ncbi:MAG TPA: DNA-directed RNA polymerase subunit omega [Terriglobales bacterium]|nr:DNA-directed RNA polymerase subunit omega [Terriglobales bacterium]